MVCVLHKKCREFIVHSLGNGLCTAQKVPRVHCALAWERTSPMSKSMLSQNPNSYNPWRVLKCPTLQFNASSRHASNSSLKLPLASGMNFQISLIPSKNLKGRYRSKLLLLKTFAIYVGFKRGCFSLHPIHSIKPLKWWTPCVLQTQTH